MTTSSTSSQPNSIWSFIQAYHDDKTPLFLRPLLHFRSFEQESKVYLSLVDFIKEGNNPDNKATEKACAILENITPVLFNEVTSEQVLFELVPTPDGSCSGFTESIVLLLTRSNEMISRSILRLLDGMVSCTSPDIQFDFIATGVFEHLPQAFYEQELHLSPPSDLFLMATVAKLLSCSTPSSTQIICRDRQLSVDTFQQTFLDKFFRPIEPFLVFVCNQRRRIAEVENSEAFDDFPNLIGTIVECSPFMEEMTQFFLTSPFAVTLLNCLHFYDNDNVTCILLEKLSEGFGQWRKDSSAVQKLGQHIVAKLREEGLTDQIELHHPIVDAGPFGIRIPGLITPVGVRLIRYLGGNTSF
ncbi:hypothetical protein BLNAU_24062 [Blattamonas nauphoetae]|uniref:Uncharacterized protein n=1 Tax=Blattamonas nauphoetae TaxID=2049346 RepID=A0ABQ9WNG9_9EUKA|nr:hypothetical protein BLNAU_24062 [Blattamonas nauphoetae]